MTNRVRFAPSPTGYLHVGSARTALFNWLYARGHDATFVLRIEDTDEQRSQPELVDQILRTMEWLGLDWDEGPFYQSDRRERHGEVVEQLLASEHAYVDEGAVRFRMPKGETITTDDAVRGRVEWNTDDLPDFVIRRSDGSAMFALANAIDDLDMGITHAIRGTDLLNVVPQVKLITAALDGGDGPTYAHLPLLVNEQRKKLSKRRDDVAIEDYRERGYLPEAMTNFLALLGWGPRDEVEIRPIAEIAKLFKLEDINDADAFFDLKKLEHFNATYIREMAVPEFVAATTWPPSDAASNETVAELAPLVQLRARTLNDVEGLVDWVFAPEVEIEDAAWEKAVVNGPAAAAILDETITAFETVAWEVDELHTTLAGIGEGHELKLGKTQAPVRVAVSGRLVGLPLFESLHVIGREETLRRLRAARSRL